MAKVARCDRARLDVMASCCRHRDHCLYYYRLGLQPTPLRRPEKVSAIRVYPSLARRPQCQSNAKPISNALLRQKVVGSGTPFGLVGGVVAGLLLVGIVIWALNGGISGNSDATTVDLPQVTVTN